MVTSVQEQVNRDVWGGCVEEFGGKRGWVDASEWRLATRLLDQETKLRVLDIGVGVGRTVPLLSGLAAEYVAIDFIPEFVDAARQAFPDVDIRLGDARALEFADASFDLVVFSINGIDAVPHCDRPLILREVGRVLALDGTFLFSTHNLLGPGPDERPSTFPRVTWRQPRSSLRKVVARLTHHRRSQENFDRLQLHRTEGPGWAVTTSGAHDFGILVHYETPDLLVDELLDAGFARGVEIWDDVAGVELTGDPRRLRRAYYLNVIAKREQGAAPAGLPGRIGT